MSAQSMDDNTVNERQLEEQKHFLKLTGEDEKFVAELQSSFTSIASQLIENFYDHLLSYTTTSKFLKDPRLIARLKSMQIEYFSELLSGKYDAEYARKRLQIGQKHQQIGLEPRWYLGAYNIYLQECFPAFAASLGKEVPKQLLSLLKVILLDIGLTLETYFAESKKSLKRHNSELEQALQMYYHTEVKSRQYAKLAGHEIRGSLNAIGNVIEEVVDDFSEEIPVAARDALRSANERCHQVMKVVEDILSKSDLTGTPQWVETGRLLAEIQDRLPMYADGTDVQLILPSEAPRVWADPIGLREVFANLVSNATHHLSPTGGRIEIEAQTTRERHIFTVSDNGSGIPPEQQTQIFQPFYRCDGRNHDGKGLGLYFVKRITEQHGGQVWVESVVGKGSRFSFCLPTESLWEPTNHAFKNL
ncbi:protoglobin domain-containing protein [Thalassoglobus polymorphus]|uniref:histidine kinase n=1 Tax=Thalassoglobus polymorphus TaxID=2527994 RepID=A0A517QK24_9PLAN|nr:protoglobin domain-containing protein [Thalassoglobus polymorphus]QDT31988.1 Globin-coupled histidine kinase [Thalassoglobus polymorphus]